MSWKLANVTGRRSGVAVAAAAAIASMLAVAPPAAADNNKNNRAVAAGAAGFAAGVVVGATAAQPPGVYVAPRPRVDNRVKVVRDCRVVKVKEYNPRTNRYVMVDRRVNC